MLFSSTYSSSGLMAWCRALRHGLGAGLSLVRVFRQQAAKGPAELRPAAERIADRLEAGTSLEDSLEPERNRFPPLFRDLATVGEQTGHLPEVFRELEEYYRLQLQTRRKFYQEITWPVFQFFAAVGVIALLIWVLGMIAESRGGEAMAPIGMGLTGARGAVLFLVSVGLFLAALFFGYHLLTRNVRGRAAVESFLLKVPGVGPCLEAVALQRFCLSLRLTMETGMPVPQALRMSLGATNNAAFTAQADAAVAAVRAGRELAEALALCRAFSAEFLEVVIVAEESGQIPEVMGREANHYREEVERRLPALARAASFAVWAFVAVLMTMAIFRIASVYFGAVNQFAG